MSRPPEGVGRLGLNIWILQSDSAFPWLWARPCAESTSGSSGSFGPECETRSRFWKNPKEVSSHFTRTARESQNNAVTGNHLARRASAYTVILIIESLLTEKLDSSKLVIFPAAKHKLWISQWSKNVSVSLQHSPGCLPRLVLLLPYSHCFLFFFFTHLFCSTSTSKPALGTFGAHFDILIRLEVW